MIVSFRGMIIDRDDRDTYRNAVRAWRSIWYTSLVSRLFVQRHFVPRQLIPDI